jgi:exosortase C (VPDSG-CTERM-specific)
MKTAKLSDSRIQPDVQLIPPKHNLGGWWNSNSMRLAGFAVFAFLLVALLLKPLIVLGTQAAKSDLHSYVLLVPFISAYLIYLRRDQLPRTYATSPVWATISLVAGLMAFVATRLPLSALSQNDVLTLTALSFVSFLATGGFLFLGRDWMKAAAFPIAFLLFAIPLPDRAVHYLETGSKLASAEAAHLLFGLTATPVFRDGTVFQLPGVAIEVAQECSGIRSSWVLFIASVLAANLFLRSPWRRIALIALVIPLGIIRNGFRIVVIGLLCVHAGPQMVHSAIHRRGGPVFFALTLPVLLLLLWWLRRGENRLGKRRLACENRPINIKIRSTE